MEKDDLLNNPELIAGTSLPVMEEFLTLQGEGTFAGVSAYFIRLGGCDVGCHWCDVKESWDFSHPLFSINDLAKKAKDSGAKIVVITGGEPLMYNLSPLIELLHELGLKVNIETSGAYELQGNPDWICLSPKKFKQPLDSLLKKANELKVIVYNQSDFKWAESFLEKLHENCILYLQVEWSVREKMNPAIIEYVKQNPKWRLSVQTHKYLDIP